VRQAVHAIGARGHPVDPELQHAASLRRRGVMQRVVAQKEFTLTAVRHGCGATWATADRITGMGQGEINLLRAVDVDGVRVLIAGAYDTGHRRRPWPPWRRSWIQSRSSPRRLLGGTGGIRLARSTARVARCEEATGVGLAPVSPTIRRFA
jgi:hypothetical protein